MNSKGIAHKITYVEQIKNKIMKTIFKILLVPVVIGLIFTIVSGLLWCVGSLLLLINIDLLPHYGDVYTFAEIVVVGVWHLLVLILVVKILGVVYNAVDSVFN